MEAKRIPKFKAWLESQGSEVMQPTNQYEVLRFRCRDGVGVIYQGKKGLSVNNDIVNEAWDCFTSRKSWKGKGKPSKRKNGSLYKRQLLDRDGNECFYCGDPMENDEMTIEHILSVNQGGPMRLENLALAHKACNQLAGHMPVIEKIKLRENMRSQDTE